MEFGAPYPIVQPIEGVDYSSLNPPPEERVRRRIDEAKDGRRLLHRIDRAAGSEGGGLVTGTEVLRLPAQGPGTAAACAICRPEAVLRTLPPPPADP
ncbi:hypothetical protein A6A06_16560 [Streptomyces sp. CB02923]|uniref:hypothetical protein n=1 Tax=Streptomyces sp. CB02923 TaxID=1718985 RepID=UPI00093B8CD3|nr:hypothetical protein [Streptomyces sp. CB02923]OKI02618.1 hypothetical protein A6A06_16560 [Streptomyces sp. CB02923]